MRPFLSRLVVSGFALVLATAAGAATRPVTLALKLPKKPPLPAPEVVALLTAGPIALELADARGAEDPTVVGAQREKGTDLFQWQAAQPVPATVKAMVAAVLEGWSVKLAPQADVTLKLALVKFYVTERSEQFGSTYLADVELVATVVDRSGAVLKSGQGIGHTKEPGPDGKASMFNEAMSLALRAALAEVVGSMSPDAAPPHAEIRPAVTVIDPEALFADLSRLKSAGVTEDVLVVYVAQRKLSRPLTVDEILRWKDAGIPDAAIKAATAP